jgi:hypothetical protein
VEVVGGALVGATVEGALVGVEVVDGALVGAEVVDGALVGASVGATVAGGLVGVEVVDGALVGASVGATVEGALVGALVGVTEGVEVGEVAAGPVMSETSSHMDRANPLPSIRMVITRVFTGLAGVKEKVWGTKTAVL